MRAAAYHRPEPASGCITGPAVSSMISCGLAVASTTKKKSGPRPAQAVPSFKSLASNVVVIASCSFALDAFVRSVSCAAFILSAAETLAVVSAQKLQMTRAIGSDHSRTKFMRIPPPLLGGKLILMSATQHCQTDGRHEVAKNLKLWYSY